LFSSLSFIIVFFSFYELPGLFFFSVFHLSIFQDSKYIAIYVRNINEKLYITRKQIQKNDILLEIISLICVSFYQQYSSIFPSPSKLRHYFNIIQVFGWLLLCNSIFFYNVVLISVIKFNLSLATLLNYEVLQQFVYFFYKLDN